MASRILATPRPVTTRTLHAPSSNTAAVVTLAAVPNFHHVIRIIFWSYNAAPIGGRLTITDGGVTQLDFDITEAGPGPMPLEMVFNENSQVVVTLAAGGGSTSGKLTVVHYLESFL